MKTLKRTATFILLIIAFKTTLFSQSSPNDILYDNLTIAGGCFDALSGATIISSLALNAAQLNAPAGANLTIPRTFPPRVGLGLLSIAYGSAIVANANNFDNNASARRAVRMGISDIALGAGDIIIPPLLNLLFLGIRGDSTPGRPKAPPVDLSLFVPRSVSGNFGLGFSLHKLSDLYQRQKKGGSKKCFLLSIIINYC